MSTRKAEAFHAGTVDGHEDAHAGKPMRTQGPGIDHKGRDGYALLYDQADADAYWSGYIRSYEDEVEGRS